MAECNQPEDKLVCDNCEKDTFAIRRENGLEVKYRDRWILVLNDAVGTILFRCRLCNSVTVCSLDTGAGPGHNGQRLGNE